MALVEVCNGCRTEITPGTGLKLEDVPTQREAILCRRCKGRSKVMFEVSPGQVVEQYLDAFMSARGEAIP